VTDSVPAACGTLARGLSQTLGCEALCAASTAEVLRCHRAEKDAIRVIVYSLESGPDEGLSFIRKIKEPCNAAAIRVPRFLVLTPGPLTVGYESRFRTIGADCLLFGFVQQVYATVRRVLFEAMCEKGRPTIIVDRSEPESRFFILGAAGSELIP